MIHKAFNKTEIAILYYKRLGRDYTRKQAENNFRCLKNVDIECLMYVFHDILDEQKKIIELAVFGEAK